MTVTNTAGETFKVGDEIHVETRFGYRWAIIEEIDEDGMVWAHDQEGEDHEVKPSDLERYPGT